MTTHPMREANDERGRDEGLGSMGERKGSGPLAGAGAEKMGEAHDQPERSDLLPTARSKPPPGFAEYLAILNFQPSLINSHRPVPRDAPALGIP